jgi:SAM-dependent methyltransferase
MDTQAARAFRFLASGKDYHRLLLDAWLPQTGVVIDVGCGLGRVTNFYDRPARRVFGADLDRDALAAAREVAGKSFLVCDAGALPFRSGAADAYVGLGILELDPTGGRALLSEAWRVLKADGSIYLTVPFLNRRRRRAGTAMWGGRVVPAFSPESAGRLLTAAGFVVERTRPSSLAWSLGPFGRPAARLFHAVIGREDERTPAYKVIAPLLKPYANSLLVMGRKRPAA